jgi:hypothetical protein
MRRSTFFALALVIGVSACDDKKTSQPAGSGGTSSSSVKEKKEKVPNEPCHPGCFPAGTRVATPTGPRAIESIKAGEVVTLVGPDGTAMSGPVHSVFKTDNRLVEIRTEAGSIRTTLTQPLCLTAGGFRTAEDLKAGDQIWRWADGKRQATRVTGVAKTDVDAPVFNLVVGESAIFVAGGFLARGKPPAVETGRTASSGQ